MMHSTTATARSHTALLLHRHLLHPPRRRHLSSFPIFAATKAASAASSLPSPRHRHDVVASSFSAAADSSTSRRTTARRGNIDHDAESSPFGKLRRRPHDQNSSPPPDDSLEGDEKKKKEDWRTMFRSWDYDDPWSPYHPLEPRSGGGDPDEGEYRRGIVKSVVEGTWERRRHGMNLEPLLCTAPTTARQRERNRRVAGSDEEGDRDATMADRTGEDREEQWEEDSLSATARDRTSRADAQSRFLCRMLDDLYRTGIRREVDRPTTERCHRAIGRVLTLTPKDPPKINDDGTWSSGTTSFSGIAQRTGAILQRMELCSPVIPRTNDDEQQSTSDDSENNNDDSASQQPHGDDDDDDTTGPWERRSYQDHPNTHLSQTKFALPQPTRAIYNMVMLAYAKEFGQGGRVAQESEDVVWGMLVRAIQRMHSVQLEQQRVDGVPGNGKILEASSLLFPSIENWNCALRCWSTSADPDRSFRSYSFLLSWMEWNEKFRKHFVDRKKKLPESKVVSLEDVDDAIIRHPDAESFRLVLRSCLVEARTFGGGGEFDDGDDTEDDNIRRAKEMGSGVAIRLWKEMLNDNSRKTSAAILDSEAYHGVVGAICQTPDLSINSKALSALARVLARCRKEGMITTEISDLVRAAASESQFARLLGANDAAVER
mmetsp:Transcript_11426/g.28150  ORF Transcript_11426/g.28150 Transcript_11426/m.28150 type:complete len:659 (-) Transcript_11426:1200-3176(-)